MKPVAYKNISVSGAEWLSEKDLFSKYGVKVIPLYSIDFTKYKVVPIEPTEEMIEKCGQLPPEMSFYKAMIEAAPKIEDI